LNDTFDSNSDDYVYVKSERFSKVRRNAWPTLSTEEMKPYWEWVLGDPTTHDRKGHPTILHPGLEDIQCFYLMSFYTFIDKSRITFGTLFRKIMNHYQLHRMVLQRKVGIRLVSPDTDPIQSKGGAGNKDIAFLRQLGHKHRKS